MKQMLKASGVGSVLLATFFSGCTPSQEELQARDAKMRVVCEQQLAAAETAVSVPALKRAIERAYTKVGPAQSLPMIQQSLERLLGNRHYGVVEGVTAYILSSKGLKELHPMAFSVELNCYNAEQKWPEFQRSMENAASMLPDAAAEQLVDQGVRTLKQAGKDNMLEKSSQVIYRGALQKPRVLNLATRSWVGLCVAKDRQHLPEHLESLLADKVPVDQVAVLYERYFYEVTDLRESVKKLSRLGSKLMEATQNKTTRDSMTLRLLDCAFLLENYDLAISMLEKGIPNRSEEWHATTLPKIQAHQAMAQGKPLEAIQHFRHFMVAWKNAKEVDEVDPSTGLVYNRDWILARNALRIAKLYASLPNEAENHKNVMKEAEAYFKSAKAQVKPGSRELIAIQQEIKEAGL
jgi:tetratricopeptide (TPR) repeat protein